MKRAFRAAGLAAVAIAVIAACGDPVYVYFARRYDGSRDCLERVVALDIMSGTDPGLGCAPRCIAVKADDGGVDLYGTTACGPTPLGANATETDPRCPAVKAAVQSTNLCTADSGIKDAGNDAMDSSVDSGIDAGSDAPFDAPTDASSD